MIRSPAMRVLAAAAALAVAAGLTSLGFWQLDRAAEKAAYQRQYLARLGEPPQPPPAPLTDADFLRIRLDGHYQRGRDYLVDNRVHRGRPGYWVVSRFEARDGRVFLVNRGWIVAPPSRDRLPALTTPEGRVRLVGVVWPDTGLPPLLAADAWPDTWPKRVQRLDVARMAREGGNVVPVEVRLESGQPGALTAVPVTDASFRPERHRGYAFQWFAMAATLAVACLIYVLRGGSTRDAERQR